MVLRFFSSFLRFQQSTNSSTGLPPEMRLGLLSPLYMRKLFERMGATYIKLGQVSCIACCFLNFMVINIDQDFVDNYLYELRPSPCNYVD